MTDDFEASSSTSAVRATPLNSLSEIEVAQRIQQTPLQPSIRGGIHSFEMRFVCGWSFMNESIFHCLCGKILYGDWQIQKQQHLTSEVHTTWVRLFLAMTADVQLFHLNKKWDFFIIHDNEADLPEYRGIDRKNALVLHYKGNYENDENEGEQSRDRAEVELGSVVINNGEYKWIGNKIILIVNPI